MGDRVRASVRDVILLEWYRLAGLEAPEEVRVAAASYTEAMRRAEQYRRPEGD